MDANSLLCSCCGVWAGKSGEQRETPLDSDNFLVESMQLWYEIRRTTKQETIKWVMLLSLFVMFCCVNPQRSLLSTSGTVWKQRSDIKTDYVDCSESADKMWFGSLFLPQAWSMTEMTEMTVVNCVVVLHIEQWSAPPASYLSRHSSDHSFLWSITEVLSPLTWWHKVP